MFLAFGLVDSYAGYPLHHTESAWTVGDPSHQRKRDLAEHIMASTVDYDIGGGGDVVSINHSGSWLSLLCFELMPNHALHHIFPTVDCSRFDVVRPVLERTLAEFGVRQKRIGVLDIYMGMFPAWLRGTEWEHLVKKWRRPSETEEAKQQKIDSFKTE